MAKLTSIPDLGTTTNYAIYQQLMPVMTKTAYPKILYIDAIADNNSVALAVAVNHIAAFAGGTKRTDAVEHHAHQARYRRGTSRRS